MRHSMRLATGFATVTAGPSRSQPGAVRSLLGADPRFILQGGGGGSADLDTMLVCILVKSSQNFSDQGLQAFTSYRSTQKDTGGKMKKKGHDDTDSI